MSGSTHRRRHDVVIVGAGLAGVTAARELATNGIEPTVLEARNRVGGRTHGRTLSTDESLQVELGAQWISSDHRRVLDLVEGFDLEIVPQYDAGPAQTGVCETIYEGEHPMQALPEDSLTDLLDALERIETMRQEIPLDEPAEAAQADSWDGTTLETWAREAFRTDAARRVFDAYVRAEFCVEPAAVSLLQFLSAVHASDGVGHLATGNAGAEEYRLAGGCQQLSRELAAELEAEIQFGEPVRTIDRSGPESVTVRTDDEAYESTFVIVAVPPPLAGRIEYEPSLPARRKALTQRMQMGSVIKWFAVYDRPFWREDGYSGAVLTADDPFVETADATPPDESVGILVGFIAGKRALWWSERTVTERRSQIEDALVRYFGSQARETLEYVDVAWSQVPWSEGGYNALATPGAITACGGALREPIGRIHWAGSETALEWRGYMEGAVASGTRAATEVRNRLADQHS